MANGHNSSEPLTPRSDRDAERAVLGAMLRDNALIGDVNAVLARGDFYVLANQHIYGAALDIYADGGPVDLVTVCARLKAAGLLDDSGGPDYVVGLWDAASSPSQALYYANLVRGEAALRELLHVAEHIRAAARADARFAADVLAEIEQMVFNISKERAGTDTLALPRVLAEAADLVSDQMRRRVSGGIPTGLLDLDQKTGGLRDGEFVVLAARPSLGKTSLALQMFLACADNDVPAAFFSLEMSRQELAERAFCVRGGVDSRRLRSRHLTAEDQDAIVRVCDEFSHATGLHVCDSPNMTVLRIVSEARRLKLRAGIKAVFIDYLQLVTPDDRRAQRQEQVSAASRRLKLLSRELNIPVVVLAQLNRNSEERPDRRPRKSDLRESGAIEADGDVILLLHKPDQPDCGENYVVEIIVDKNRNGPTGSVDTIFRGAHMRFENYAPGDPGA